MNQPTSTKRFRLLPGLSLFLFCLGLGFAFFFFSSSPVSAAIFAPATPTQENLWAFVNVAKPAAQQVPTLVPVVSTMTLIPTEAPGVMNMQIVADTAIPTNAPVDAQSAPAPASISGKYILVSISEQHMYVYENGNLIYSFVASTGIHNATRAGNFAIQSKIPNAYGSTWNIWMPDWLGIYWAGGLENGIHALPILPSGATLWAGFLGRPISYGCVVLGTYDASLLYDWAEIGVPVEIQR